MYLNSGQYVLGDNMQIDLVNLALSSWKQTL